MAWNIRMYTDPLPAWLPAVGAVANLSSSTLTSSGAGWAGTSPGGTGNYQTVVTAWSGGVLNTVGVYRSGSFVPGKFLCLFGGGHGDYAGNELYAFGPLDGTPSWSRIIDPTVPGPDDVERSGGYPVSRHSYDTLVYLPSTNQMLCIGCPGYFHTGSNFNVGDLFDFDTNPAGNPWSTADTDFPAYGGGGAGAINLLSGYDAATGAAWGLGGGNGQKLGRYIPGSGWSSWDINNPDGPSDSKAAVDPVHTVMVFVTASGAARAIDLRTPTATVYTPSTTGTGPSGRCAVEWDAVGERFVCWPGSGNVFYFLTPPANPYSGGSTWTWTSATATGDSVATQTTNGTFGRFRYVVGSEYRGMLVMPAHNQPISFYRMS